MFRHILLFKSQTFNVLSSEFENKISSLGWNATHETLFWWPLRVSISHALAPDILHSLIDLSSAPEAMRFHFGWKLPQLIPFSWPSNTCLTSISVPRNTSTPFPSGPPLYFWDFSFSKLKSHTLIVWSSDEERRRFSSGWKKALMT